MSSLPWSSKGLKGTPILADELLILDSVDLNPATQNKRITIGSLPPSEVFTWTANHDAAGFDLLNVGGVTISNPADTFQYIITPAALLGDRIVDLPLLVDDDVFVFEDHAQPLTNKTIDENLNSILQSTPVVGEYLRDNGTKFVASAIVNTDLPSAIDSQKIALTDGNFLVGNASNEATSVTMSGNATLDNLGALTIVDNSVTNAMTATFTTTKISTLSKSLLNASIVYGDQNNTLGAFYEDISEISAPSAPASGTRRLFVDSATGEISVRTSAATTVSLETPAPTPVDVVVGVVNVPENRYDDTSHQFFGNDNGSQTLGITLGTTEPVGTTYTHTYTIDANDFPSGMTGFDFTQYGLMMSTQVINNDAVASTVSAKFFINDVEFDVGGGSRSISAGNFGLFSGYKRDHVATVGDTIQVKLWTDGSILVDLEKFGVYTMPYRFELTADISTARDANFIEDLSADAPLGVTLANKNNTYFPDFYVGNNDNTFAAQYPFGTPRMISGEFLQDTNSNLENVQTQNTATNQMYIPQVNAINLYRAVT